MHLDTQGWPTLSWARLRILFQMELRLGDNLIMGLMPVGSTLPMLLIMFLLLDVVIESVDHVAGVRAWALGAAALLFIALSLLHFFVATFECQYLRRQEWTWVQQQWAASFWQDSMAVQRSWRQKQVIYLVKSFAMNYLAMLAFYAGSLYSTGAVKESSSISSNNSLHSRFSSWQECHWIFLGITCVGLFFAFQIRALVVASHVVISGVRLIATRIYMRRAASIDGVPRNEQPFRTRLIQVASQIATQFLWAIALLCSTVSVTRWIASHDDMKIPVPDWYMGLHYSLFAIAIVFFLLGFPRWITFRTLWRRVSRTPEPNLEL